MESNFLILLTKKWSLYDRQLECKVIRIYRKNNLGYLGYGIRNKYQGTLEGDFILHANDNSFYTPNAFEIIRKNVKENKLYIFDGIYYDCRSSIRNNNELKLGFVDTTFGVVPNQPDKMGHWLLESGGDFKFYQTCKFEIKFIDEIISVLCPNVVNKLIYDYSFDSSLASEINKLLYKETIVDLGRRDYCKLRDKVNNERYDWVVSIEVGGHIPICFEQRFLNTITNTAKKGIILNWNNLEQKGYNRFYCFNWQSNSYIENEIKKRGWYRDFIVEEQLKQKSTLYKKSLMVYKKEVNNIYWCKSIMN